MEIEQFKFLKANRTYLRGKVTRYCNNISSQVASFSIKECKDAVADLNNFRSKLDQANLEISKGIWGTGRVLSKRL